MLKTKEALKFLDGLSINHEEKKKRHTQMNTTAVGGEFMDDFQVFVGGKIQNYKDIPDNVKDGGAVVLPVLVNLSSGVRVEGLGLDTDGKRLSHTFADLFSKLDPIIDAYLEHHRISKPILIAIVDTQVEVKPWDFVSKTNWYSDEWKEVAGEHFRLLKPLADEFNITTFILSEDSRTEVDQVQFFGAWDEVPLTGDLSQMQGGAKLYVSKETGRIVGVTAYRLSKVGRTLLQHAGLSVLMAHDVFLIKPDDDANTLPGLFSSTQASLCTSWRSSGKLLRMTPTRQLLLSRTSSRCPGKPTFNAWERRAPTFGWQ